MWTPTTRRQHSRNGLRYETDLTDAEWALIEPHLPPPPEHGRPRFWPTREIMNAIFYVLRGGIAWRLLPTDLPPRTTVYRWWLLSGSGVVTGSQATRQAMRAPRRALPRRRAL